MSEILIVVTVFGIVAAMAVPNISARLLKHRLKGASQQILWDLMAARMQAIKQDTTLKVTFPNPHAYTIWNDTDGDNFVDVGETITKASDLHGDYPGVAFGEPLPPVFSFTSSGRASLAQNIRLSNASGSKRVSVTITGKVTLN